MVEQPARRAQPCHLLSWSVPVSGLAWIHTWSQSSTSTECPLGGSSEAQAVGAISCHRGDKSGLVLKRDVCNALAQRTYSILPKKHSKNQLGPQETGG